MTQRLLLVAILLSGGYLVYLLGQTSARISPPSPQYVIHVSPQIQILPEHPQVDLDAGVEPDADPCAPVQDAEIDRDPLATDDAWVDPDIWYLTADQYL